jgi:hypothetical protein
LANLAAAFANSVNISYVTANYASQTANYASMTANYASITSNYGSVTSNYASVTGNYASQTANYGSVTSNYASITSNYASQTANYACNLANLAAAFANSVNISYVTANYASQTANYGSVTSNYASITSNYGSVTSNYASQTSNYASQTANYGSVTSNYASITSNYAWNSANYASQTSNYASVTSNYASRTANYSSITSNYASQTSNYASDLSNVVLKSVQQLAAVGPGVSFFSLSSDIVATTATGQNGDYVVPISSFTQTSALVTAGTVSILFGKTGIYNVILSLQAIDTRGYKDGISNVYVYTNTSDSTTSMTLVYRDTTYSSLGSQKTQITIPVYVTDITKYYIVGVSFLRSLFPYTLKMTYLPTGSGGGSYIQVSFLGGSSDTVALGVDAKTLNNIGTTSGATVTVGNINQSLVLNGSSVTLPSAVNISAGVTTELGTSATSTVTVGNSGQALILQGTPVSLPSSTDSSLLQNIGTSAQGIVTVGSLQRQLVLRGSSLSLPYYTDISKVANFGTNPVSTTVTVGSTNKILNLLGSVVNLPSTTSATSVNNLGTNPSYFNVTIGNTANTYINGSNVILGGNTFVKGTFSINNIKNPVTIGGAMSDEYTAITNIGKKMTIYSPFSFNISNPPYVTCTTAPITGTYTIDVQLNEVTIFDTPPTITSGLNIATNSSLNSSTISVVQGTRITFWVTSTGSGMTGLKCILFCN